jgi:hypothetical protein
MVVKYIIYFYKNNIFNGLCGSKENVEPPKKELRKDSIPNNGKIIVKTAKFIERISTIFLKITK